MNSFKGKGKSFLAGFLVSGLLFGSIAFAASSKIDVVFDNIRYMFDGVEKKPAADAKGFIYKGTVYAPISFISQSLGKNVAYDGKAKTVWVGQRLGSYKYLDSINYARYDTDSQLNSLYFGSWKDKYSGINFKICENTYLHGIGAYFYEYANNSSQSIDYNLNGAYKTLNGKIGIDDNTKNSIGYGRIRIYGDGEEIYASDLMRGGDMPKDINIDIKGILRLQVKFEVSGDGCPDIILGDAKVIQ